MTAENQIALYGGLFYLCLAIAIIGIGLAVFFFFFFDIRSVHELMTGKAKRKTIERMAEQNSKTGRLYQNPLSGNMKSENLAAQATVAKANMDTESIGTASQTTVLHPDEAATSILTEPAPQPAAPVQRSMAAGMTAPLNPASQSNVPAIRFDITERTLVIHTKEII